MDLLRQMTPAKIQKEEYEDLMKFMAFTVEIKN